jgi:hypothetical protein
MPFEFKKVLVTASEHLEKFLDKASKKDPVLSFGGGSARTAKTGLTARGAAAASLSKWPLSKKVP